MAKRKAKKVMDLVFEIRRKIPRPTLIYKSRRKYNKKDISWKNPENW